MVLSPQLVGLNCFREGYQHQFYYFILMFSFLRHKITSRHLSSLSYPLQLAKAKFPLERAPLRGRWEGEMNREQAGLAAGCSSSWVLVDGILQSHPFRTEPCMGDLLTQHMHTSFLIMRKKEKPRLKVQVVSGDAQCLFRKSSGFCVFHMSFSEPQTHVKWASGANEAETRRRASGSCLTHLRAEARDWQACFVLAHWLAGKLGLPRSVCPSMARGRKYQEVRAGCSVQKLQNRVAFCRSREFVSFCCFPSVLATCLSLVLVTVVWALETERWVLHCCN